MHHRSSPGSAYWWPKISEVIQDLLKLLLTERGQVVELASDGEEVLACRTADLARVCGSFHRLG